MRPILAIHCILIFELATCHQTSSMRSSNVLFVGTPRIRECGLHHSGEHTTYSLIELSDPDLQNLCVEHGVKRTGIWQRDTLVSRLRTMEISFTTQMYKTRLCKLLSLKNWEDYHHQFPSSTKANTEDIVFETVMNLLGRTSVSCIPTSTPTLNVEPAWMSSDSSIHGPSQPEAPNARSQATHSTPNTVGAQASQTKSRAASLA